MVRGSKGRCRSDGRANIISCCNYAYVCAPAPGTFVCKPDEEALEVSGLAFSIVAQSQHQTRQFTTRCPPPLRNGDCCLLAGRSHLGHVAPMVALGLLVDPGSILRVALPRRRRIAVGPLGRIQNHLRPSRTRFDDEQPPKRHQNRDRGSKYIRAKPRNQCRDAR